MAISHLYPTQRPALDLNFARQKRLDSRVTFTRGSTATYVDSDGLIKTAASGEARFDHDTDGNSLGLLIEEARTNFIADSRSSSLPQNGTTRITSSTVLAPDGTFAVRIGETNTLGKHGCYYSLSGLANNTQTTFSIYAKAAEKNWVSIGFQDVSFGYNKYTAFDLSTGTIGTNTHTGTIIFNPASASITPVGNGWYRLSVSRGTNAANAFVWMSNSNPTGSSYDGNAQFDYQGGTSSDGVYLFGAQVEEAPFGAQNPTSYIPTSGSTVTRSADVASMTGTNFSSWYNQSEGSFFAESKLLGFSNFAFTASVNGSDGYIDAPHRRQTDSVFYSVLHGPPGNTNQVLLVSQTTSLTSTSKAANAFRVNDYAYCLNGGTVLVDNLLNLPTPTSLSIGGQNGNYLLNGHISRLTYYSTRLPDATLQALTL